MGSKSEPKSFRCSTASWAKPAVLCGDDVNKSIAIKYAAWRCLRKAIDNATAASHVSVSWLLLLLLRSAFGHSSAQAQQRMETKLPAWQADFETNSTESNRIGRLHGFEMISQCARGGQFRLSSADSIHSRFIRIEWNQSNHSIAACLRASARPSHRTRTPSPSPRAESKCADQPSPNHRPSGREFVMIRTLVLVANFVPPRPAVF